MANASEVPAVHLRRGAAVRRRPRRPFARRCPTAAALPVAASPRGRALPARPIQRHLRPAARGQGVRTPLAAEPRGGREPRRRRRHHRHGRGGPSGAGRAHPGVRQPRHPGHQPRGDAGRALRPGARVRASHPRFRGPAARRGAGEGARPRPRGAGAACARRGGRRQADLRLQRAGLDPAHGGRAAPPGHRRARDARALPGQRPGHDRPFRGRRGLRPRRRGGGHADGAVGHAARSP